MNTQKVEHTPGPWHINGSAIESKNEWVCSFDSNGQYSNDEANARLIAASPELLEAAKAVLPYLRKPGESTIKAWKLEQAIRKATG